MVNTESSFCPRVTSLFGSSTRGSSFIFVWLHCWEQKNLLDVVSISQKHCQSVDTHSPSSSWWKTVLKSSNESLINSLGLFITSSLCISLLKESFKLYLWIIQLSVCVNDFMSVNEQFKTFSQTFLTSVPFGEWAH